MSEERRSATKDPERHPVVTKTGLIKMCAVGGNLGGALVEYEGEVKVAYSHQKEHWVLLEDLYKAEGRMDRWKIYQDMRAAKRAGAEVETFPDRLLPEEVLKRRAGQTPGRKVFVFPEETEADKRADKRADKVRG